MLIYKKCVSFLRFLISLCDFLISYILMGDGYPEPKSSYFIKLALMKFPMFFFLSFKLFFKWISYYVFPPFLHLRSTNDPFIISKIYDKTKA